MGRGKSSIFRETARRGQVSVEYILIVGFAMAMTLPLLLIFHNQSQDINRELSDAQITKIANEIVTAIDSVYYLGPRSSRTIEIYFPLTYKGATVYNQSFAFRMESPSGDYDVTRQTAPLLDGTFRNTSGLHVITFRANENNVTIQD